MRQLEQAIGYKFQDGGLLRTAMTHSSYANEHRAEKARHYERLEFLGDSILGFVTAEHLFTTHKNAEGELTRMRANFVCEPTLAKVARRLNFGEHLRLGKGEQSAGGGSRPSILADAVEAVIGAIYLDGGIEAAAGFVHRFILSNEELEETETIGDYKTDLQERVQRDRSAVLSYRLVAESGPDHEKTFEVEAVVNGEAVGRGTGRSKKEAEQAAARDALRRLKA